MSEGAPADMASWLAEAEALTEAPPGPKGPAPTTTKRRPTAQACRKGGTSSPPMKRRILDQWWKASREPPARTFREDKERSTIRLSDLGSAAEHALDILRGVPVTIDERVRACAAGLPGLSPRDTRDPLIDPASRDPLLTGGGDPLRDSSADPLTGGRLP